MIWGEPEAIKGRKKGEGGREKREIKGEMINQRVGGE